MDRQTDLPDGIIPEFKYRQRDRAPQNRAPETLVSLLCEQVPAILAKEPVQLAYLHGSSVTGRTTPFSDVDIALVVGDTIEAGDRLQLILRVQLALADRCGIENPDVRVIDGAPLVFLGRVVTGGVLLYARDEAQRIAFETDTRMRYFDYLPIHRRLQAEFFEVVRERGLYG